MEKINFEDATLKKSAYVTIDGTEYPVTDAEYEGGTNLDAETLNYAFKLMHPIGSIYMTTVETNPSEIFGFGTWELWGAGRVPVGVDTTQAEFNEVEKLGGEKIHTLTVAEIPTHEHDEYFITNDGNRNQAITGNNGSINGTYAKLEDSFEQNRAPLVTGTTGGSQPHNNLQPYITCYMFKRTA